MNEESLADHERPEAAGTSHHHSSDQWLEYKGFLIVGGRHTHTRVATFRVLRPARDSDEVALVYEGIAERRFATDQAALEAGADAGRAYVDSLPRRPIE